MTWLSAAEQAALRVVAAAGGTAKPPRSEADELFRVAMGLPVERPLSYRAAQVAARIRHLEQRTAKGVRVIAGYSLELGWHCDYCGYQEWPDAWDHPDGGVPLSDLAAAAADHLRGAHPMIGPEDDEPQFGETIFAELVTCDPQRNDVEYWLGCLVYGHLPAHLQDASRPFSELARHLFDPLFEGDLPFTPDDVLTARMLVQAKDAAVRAAVHRHLVQQEEASDG